MACRLCIALIVGLMSVRLVEAADPPALVKAHALYNAGDFEGAIQTAEPLTSEPATTHAASLVIGRARLQQYRQNGDAVVLESARVALSSVVSDALGPREQVELLIGMGQVLFFGDVFGGAAELFDTAHGRSDLLGDRDRWALLDWWASTLDRQAQTLPPDRRLPIYERIVARVETQLRVEPGNGPANYWLVAGTRGVGDIGRAWDAAVAGWIRASLTSETAAATRADIDRLVTEALAIEVGRRRSGPEPEDAVNATRAEWELLKRQWP